MLTLLKLPLTRNEIKSSIQAILLHEVSIDESRGDQIKFSLLGKLACP